MTFYNRKYLTAWLGLIAMWLIVFAPVVSQLVASARADEPVAALCSAVQPSTPEHHAPIDSLDACGYCNLLTHHVAAPSIPPVALSVLVLVSVAGAEHSLYAARRFPFRSPTRSSCRFLIAVIAAGRA
jgi:hypothetical protein